MTNVNFSVAPESNHSFSDDAAVNIITPGYAEYWLVNQGLAVIPTSDETEEFWGNYLKKIRVNQSSPDTKFIGQLNAELDAAENCLAVWAEYFLTKYFFIRSHIDIKQGTISQDEMERHFLFIERDRTRKDWNREVSALSDTALQEELDDTANNHHALNAMLNRLRLYRSSDDPFSHHWMFDKDFLSCAHNLEFYTESWERLCSAYETAFQDSGQSSEGNQRKEELRAKLYRLIEELTEIRDIAEEHWHTITTIKNKQQNGITDVGSLAEYLDEKLVVKYNSIGVERLCALQEDFESSISAMNTMLQEIISLVESFETVLA